MVGLCVERGISALRLYNKIKFTLPVGVKIHSKASSACILVINVNKYSVFYVAILTKM